VEEKLLLNRYDKRLNVFRRDERTNQRRGSCGRCRADMRGLANLAGRFILSLGMGVTQSLGNE
jgi:hypothetical protein